MAWIVTAVPLIVTVPAVPLKAERSVVHVIFALVAAEPVPETLTGVKTPAVTVPEVATPPVPSRLFAVAPVMAAELRVDLVE